MGGSGPNTRDGMREGGAHSGLVYVVRRHTSWEPSAPARGCRRQRLKPRPGGPRTREPGDWAAGAGGRVHTASLLARYRDPSCHGSSCPWGVVWPSTRDPGTTPRVPWIAALLSLDILAHIGPELPVAK